MPPSKAARAVLEDSKIDSAQSKDKHGNSNGNAQSAHQISNGKLRRVASSTGTNLRGVTNAASLPSPPILKIAQPVVPSLQWSEFDRSFLHKYRREHHLPTPTASASDYRTWVINRTGGIGLNSPTATRRRDSRRQTKGQLTNTVRKHFNAQGIQETDAIVEFLHKIRSDGASATAEKKKVAPGATHRI